MVEFPGDNGSYYADGSRPSNTEPLELDRKLVMAAVEGQLLRVEHLLARGAVVHFFDIRNEASEKVVGEEEIYFTALIEAASFRHVAVVQALIKVVADANQRIPHSEWQAIHASSAAGGAEIVETVLAAGAPVDSWLAFGATPLCLAVRHYHPDAGRRRGFAQGQREP